MFRMHRTFSSECDVLLTSLNSLDEVRGEINTIGYLCVTWRDDRIQWDPASYRNLTSMMMPIDQVWHPNLVVSNPTRTISTMNVEKTSVRYLWSGLALWHPGDVFHTKCYPDIYYYPFDEQTCYISILPWGNLLSEVLIRSTQPGVLTLGYEDNGEWTLLKTWSMDFTLDDKPVVRFYFTFKRRAQFLLANIIMPIVLLNFLNCLIFLLPVGSGERVSCAVTVLLSFAVFSTLVGDTIPKTSDPVPLLCYYLITVVSGSTLIMVANIFSIHVYYRDPTTPVTGIYRLLASNTCKRKRGNKTDVIEIQPDTTTKNGDNYFVSNSCQNILSDDENITWIEVSKRLDKLFICLSLALFIISSILPLIIVPVRAN